MLELDDRLLCFIWVRIRRFTWFPRCTDYGQFLGSYLLKAASNEGRRGPDEINVLVRQFSESGGSQDLYLKVGVNPPTVARWVESCGGKPLTDGPSSLSPSG